MTRRDVVCISYPGSVPPLMSFRNDRSTGGASIKQVLLCQLRLHSVGNLGDVGSMDRSDLVVLDALAHLG